MKGIPVFFETFRVGLLEIGETGSPSFRYDPRWQASRNAFPVSMTMPLDRSLFAPEVVHPWIENLLPEGQPLASVARNLGLSRLDSLAIIERIGGDVAGALSIGAPASPAEGEYVPLTEFYNEPDPGTALLRHFDDLYVRPFLAGEDGVRLSLAGGEEKTVLAVTGADGRPKPGLMGDGDRLAVPLGGAPSTVIIKPDKPLHLEGSVENEACCLTLATAIGLEAAEVGTLQAGNRTALAVVRYDRIFTSHGTVRRLHQEDFAQALGVPPSRKYERGVLPGPSMNDILAVGGRDWAQTHGASSELAVRERLRILDQVIFNVLVANTDAHAKNYGLLLNGGEVRAAPLYDVSCVLPWPRIDQNFAQRIAGKKRRPGDIAPRHWKAIAREAGFNEHHVRERVERMADGIRRKVPDVASRVSAMPGVSPGMVELVCDLIRANALRIMGRIATSAHAKPGWTSPAGRASVDSIAGPAGAEPEAVKDDAMDVRPG